MYIEEQIERYGEDRRADLWLAWHVAALSRAKRLPSLKKLMQVKSRNSDELSNNLKAAFAGLEAKGKDDGC